MRSAVELTGSLVSGAAAARGSRLYPGGCNSGRHVGLPGELSVRLPQEPKGPNLHAW